MKVAILHNRHPAVPDPALPDDAFEEYDSEETIGAIAESLAKLDIAPVPVIAGRNLPRQLEEGGFDFVFNIAEGAGRRSREAVPAAVCELLGIPYTGSDPLTLAISLDKVIACRIVSPDVPIANSSNPGYPVIVKPRDEGSSIGIRSSALCHTESEASERARALEQTYGCPVLIEEFLPGMEVTVGIAGNGRGTRILGMMEIAPALPDGPPFIYSLEVKRDYRNRVRYHVPPRLPQAAIDTLRQYALAAYSLLGCRDIARIDFRLDAEGCPRFIECNPLPGLNPESGDIAILSRNILSYDALIQGIFLDARQRLS